jgi:hypothetical protein
LPFVLRIAPHVQGFGIRHGSTRLSQLARRLQARFFEGYPSNPSTKISSYLFAAAA